MAKRVLAIRGLEQETYDTFRWRAKAMGLTQPEFLAQLLEVHSQTLPQFLQANYLNATRVPADASELSANRDD